MSRILKPGELLARRANTLEPFVSDPRIHHAIVAPLQKNHGAFEVGDRAQIQAYDRTEQILLEKIIAILDSRRLGIGVVR